jgi:haloacetate dehalogenase
VFALHMSAFRGKADIVFAACDPATVHAICEEYRVAATLDFAQDMDDRKINRRIACPTLTLWGKRRNVRF